MFHPLVTTAPRLELRQDGPQTDCDGQNILFCRSTETCYTGSSGFVGCCSTTSCAARTTCLNYDQLSTQECDLDYGGCVPCTNSAYPSCVTLYNPEASQYALYCDTVARTVMTAYPNLITTGSTAAPASNVPRPAGLATPKGTSALMATVVSSDSPESSETSVAQSQNSAASSQTPPPPASTTRAPTSGPATSSLSTPTSTPTSSAATTSTTAAGAALPAGQDSHYNSSSSSSGSLSGGAIAGIVVASVLAVAALAAMGIWCLRKSRTVKGKGSNEGSTFASHLPAPSKLPLGGLSSPQFPSVPPVEKEADLLHAASPGKLPSEVEGSPVPSLPTTVTSRSSSVWSRRPVSRTVSPDLQARHPWAAGGNGGGAAAAASFRDAPGAVAGTVIAEMSHEDVSASARGPRDVAAAARVSASPSPPQPSNLGTTFLSAEQAMAEGYRET